jgi:hypothetical protein
VELYERILEGGKTLDSKGSNRLRARKREYVAVIDAFLNGSQQGDVWNVLNFTVFSGKN